MVRKLMGGFLSIETNKWPPRVVAAQRGPLSWFTHSLRATSPRKEVNEKWIMRNNICKI